VYPQNGQSAGRRHRNGASGETRDGGYNILKRAGLGRWRNGRFKVVSYGWWIAVTRGGEKNSELLEKARYAPDPQNNRYAPLSSGG
jgi:hypothetical protein